MKKIRVVVLILTHNRKAWVTECIERIRSQPFPLERIVVVDNHSTDGTMSFLQTRFPDIHLIRTEKNWGASIGKNIGLKTIHPWPFDYVYLVDDDIWIDDLAIEALVEVAESDPRIGLVGSKILDRDRPDILLGAGVVIDFTQNLGYGRGVFEKDVGQYDKTEPIDFLLGGSLLIRREVLDRIGYFDEGFLGYWYEAQDYCIRARKAGFLVYYASQSRVYHHAPPEDYSFRKKYLAGRNAVRFMKKHGTFYQWIKFLFFAGFGLVYAFIRETPRGRFPGVYGKALGLYDGLRGYDRRANLLSMSCE